VLDSRTSITLSYLTNSVSWSCNSSAYIRDGAILFLINAVIQKLSEIFGEPFTADVTVVTKLVSETSTHTPSPRMMMTQVASRAPMSYTESAPVIDEEHHDDVWDYRSYPLGKMSIDNYMSVPMLSIDCPATKMYIHRIPSDDTTLGYELSPNEHIPSHKASLHEDSSHRYLTNVFVKEVQAGGTAIIFLGGTSIVYCRSTASVIEVKDDSYTDDPKHSQFITTRETLNVSIYNSSNRDELVQLRYVVDDAEVTESSNDQFERKANELRFRYNIAPGNHSVEIVLVVVRRNPNVDH